MIGSRCVRGLFSLQTVRQLSSKQGTVSVPYNEERLPVKKLEPTQDQGPHYNRSYKQLSSWLNSGGHAEVFEGCHVVGKVIKIYYQVLCNKGNKGLITLYMITMIFVHQDEN